jgi:hypothetical protein
VPEAITDPTNEAQSGWIEFSAPGYGITPVHPLIIRRIMPEPSKLIFSLLIYSIEQPHFRVLPAGSVFPLMSFRQNSANEPSSVSFTCRFLPV